LAKVYKIGGIVDVGPGSDSFDKFYYYYGYDNYIYLINTIYQIRKLALAKRLRGNGLIREMIKNVNRVAKKSKYPKYNRLLKEAAERSVLFVKKSLTDPVLDGKIDPKEWGKPCFDGNFYVVYRASNKSPFKTKIWARRKGNKLYLAFDCESDPKWQGADVKSLSQTKGIYPKMTKDDSISISIYKKGNYFRALMLNSNGILRLDRMTGKAKTRKTAQGWQAEIMIDCKKSGLGSFLKSGVSKARMPIVRYIRSEKNSLKIRRKKQMKTYCTSLFPSEKKVGKPAVGGTDLDACMTFVSGPLLISSY